ncbi:prepilin-type N-terminal cleavage/methylation domain-containing protein [bacterium]|nr:prepilin-type N-terminal cleavage/methylation domain-containing protein [bacterium]MBU1884847.1 prepilin-type N-terminal cleavage/methylation domain-containing protein [bacterium]
MRKAFTLIEMMVSIVILSVMMLFLYQSYASLNSSNALYRTKVEDIKTIELKKKIIFLDFSLALFASDKIINKEKNEDIVFLQSSNSIHQRFNPYITYIVKENKLYRLESLKELSDPLPADAEFDADYFGEVKSFRVYKSKTTYLINIDFKQSDAVLMKVKGLNEL